MYLYELVNWLTTVVDSLVIKESYKDEAYKGALTYIADCLMVSCKLSPLHDTADSLQELLGRERHTHVERECDIQHPD